VLAILHLITTTPFFDFLWALRWFRVPYVLCSLLLFTYRYIFVMLEELDSMRMARRSRGFSMKGSLLSKDVFRTLSYTAGMLLVRSYERSKDIYNGLISRGFSGEIRIIRKPAIRAKDVALVTAFAVVIVAMVSIQWGVMPWMA
jgi:cobalt/nickel transport system permease protein